MTSVSRIVKCFILGTGRMSYQMRLFSREFESKTGSNKAWLREGKDGSAAGFDAGIEEILDRGKYREISIESVLCIKIEGGKCSQPELILIVVKLTGRGAELKCN